jgi:hypothetical protein
MDSPTMPQDTSSHKAFTDAVLDLRARGLSIQKTADALGTNFSRVQRFLARRKTAATNSPPNMPESAPRIKERKNVTAHPSAPGAPRLDAIEGRLSVVEAFIATIQRQPPPVNGTPNGKPECTIKRGFVVSLDLSQKIDAFAQTHRMQIKDVLDGALREYFGRHGWAGDEAK